MDLSEQRAVGDEAVGAQLGVVGQVQLEVHDGSPSEFIRNNLLQTGVGSEAVRELVTIPGRSLWMLR